MQSSSVSPELVPSGGSASGLRDSTRPDLRENGRENGQVDAHTIRAREAERSALRADIDAFLANGGKVTRVAAEFRADLPKKPQNNYGKGAL